MFKICQTSTKSMNNVFRKAISTLSLRVFSTLILNCEYNLMTFKQNLTIKQMAYADFLILGAKYSAF